MGRFVGDMTWPRFLVGYTTVLALAVAGALWAERRFHVDGERVVLAECALLFGVAAVGRPRLLYLIVRNAGWFAGIESDRAMRTVLAVLAGALALGAVCHG